MKKFLTMTLTSSGLLAICAAFALNSSTTTQNLNFQDTSNLAKQSNPWFAISEIEDLTTRSKHFIGALTVSSCYNYSI